MSCVHRQRLTSLAGAPGRYAVRCVDCGHKWVEQTSPDAPKEER